MTTVPEPINYNICTYYVYMHYNCSFANLTNFGILSKLKNETLPTYPYYGFNVQVNALYGYSFQITNSVNQLQANDFSTIDLGQCETLLKDIYGIPHNLSLIFFKFENIGNPENERNIQYEIYHPITYEKLNLTLCENKIKLSVPIKLAKEQADFIQNIIDQGYDPFDLSDKFYREICTPI